MSRNVIVTGAASGIGRASAKVFLELGDKVLLTDYAEEQLMQTASELRNKYSGSVYACRCNVADSGSVKELKRFALENGVICDVLANCAGVFRGGLLHETATEDYDIQFDVNVRGIFNTMQAFLPDMLGKQEGWIVNVASISGMRGDYNAPIYCASKAAVINLTSAAALDYAGHGIHINCVSPSATKTPMFLSGTKEDVMNAFIDALPDHKLGEPEQVACAISFLASREAAHINGHNLPVDGGLTNWNGQPKQNKEEGD